MRFEVRSSVGVLLGTIEVHNLVDLRSGSIRYARAKDTRFYGTGFLELEPRLTDPTMQVIEFKVDVWSEPPTIDKHSSYRSGRCDFCLLWDGPVEPLRQVRAFQPKL
jgi:hypothetical protein